MVGPGRRYGSQRDQSYIFPLCCTPPALLPSAMTATPRRDPAKGSFAPQQCYSSRVWPSEAEVPARYPESPRSHSVGLMDLRIGTGMIMSRHMQRRALSSGFNSNFNPVSPHCSPVLLPHHVSPAQGHQCSPNPAPS